MTPQDLARRVEQCLADAAVEWGADPATRAFAGWLADYWRADCPPPPPGAPRAISVAGKRADVFAWYEGDGVILGYVAGHRPGCYRVPCGAEPPADA